MPAETMLLLSAHPKPNLEARQRILRRICLLGRGHLADAYLLAQRKAGGLLTPPDVDPYVILERGVNMPKPALLEFSLDVPDREKIVADMRGCAKMPGLALDTYYTAEHFCALGDAEGLLSWLSASRGSYRMLNRWGWAKIAHTFSDPEWEARLDVALEPEADLPDCRLERYFIRNDRAGLRVLFAQSLHHPSLTSRILDFWQEHAEPEDVELMLATLRNTPVTKLRQKLVIHLLRALAPRDDLPLIRTIAEHLRWRKAWNDSVLGEIENYLAGSRHPEAILLLLQIAGKYPPLWLTLHGETRLNKWLMWAEVRRRLGYATRHHQLRHPGFIATSLESGEMTPQDVVQLAKTDADPETWLGDLRFPRLGQLQPLLAAYRPYPLVLLDIVHAHLNLPLPANPAQREVEAEICLQVATADIADYHISYTAAKRDQIQQRVRDLGHGQAVDAFLTINRDHKVS